MVVQRLQQRWVTFQGSGFAISISATYCCVTKGREQPFQTAAIIYRHMYLWVRSLGGCCALRLTGCQVGAVVSCVALSVRISHHDSLLLQGQLNSLSLVL